MIVAILAFLYLTYQFAMFWMAGMCAASILGTPVKLLSDKLNSKVHKGSSPVAKFLLSIFNAIVWPFRVATKLLQNEMDEDIKARNRINGIKVTVGEPG